MSTESVAVTLVIAPHPDDETLACGGAIAMRREAGLPVRILFVTDGRRAFASALGITEDPTPDELAAIRRQEARAATSILGVSPEEVVVLGIDEGALAAEPDASVLDLLTNALRDAGDVREIFLPHPQDRHPTHRAVHSLVSAALSLDPTDVPRCRYVVWSGDDAEDLGEEVRVDIEDVLETKRAAIACYRSQVGIIAPGQSHPVLDEDFLAPFRDAPVETFWR